MTPEKKAAKEAAINRFSNEALHFEQGQHWKRAAIRWEHCARIAKKNEDKGLFSYSAFFCYRRDSDIPKASAMIKQCKNKYLLIGDKMTAALCDAEIEALNAPT
jgi:hypothetical protein